MAIPRPLLDPPPALCERTEVPLGRRFCLLASGAALTVLPLGLAHARPEGTPITRCASTNSSGTQANGASSYPSISADGGRVAFASSASNLVAGDTNGVDDVFVKDLTTGAISCVSVTPGGAPGNGESSSASISGDGTRVAFASEASDLVPGDTNQAIDMFVRDLASGTTTRLSVSAQGIEAENGSSAPRLSGDGRFVVFTSRATNLVPADTNGHADVFLRDLQGGTLERVSVAGPGQPTDGPSEGATISPDGRYVAFASLGGNLVPSDPPGAPRTWNVYVRDRASGTTLRASVGPAGEKADGHSFSPAISADGRWVAFTSHARNLVASDLDGCADVFLRDMQSGVTARASVGPGGQEPDGPSDRSSLSADGRFLVFQSRAANLVAAPSPPRSTWACVRDLSTGTTTRVVAAAALFRADGGTANAAISADGRWIAFSSAEADLVAGDTNELEDVFVRGPLD